MAQISAAEVGKNVVAFLDTLAYSELGSQAKNSEDGYNVIVSGKTFADYSDHPRVLVPLPRLHISSTAAGRYQFLSRTWDGLTDRLNLSDFSPLSQDRGAIELIRQRGALDDVRSGRFATAVNKCRKEWASLPGAGYSQPEHPLEVLERVYEQHGGTITN